jgi:quinol monooxygenase YgiN
MYTLIGKWTILEGKEAEAKDALNKLATQVKNEEVGTLIYMVYTPDFNEISLPTPQSGEVIFLEVYKDKDAFNQHIAGKAFNDFVSNYGHLFLKDFSNPPQIYFTMEVLNNVGGFIRPM